MLGNIDFDNRYGQKTHNSRWNAWIECKSGSDSSWSSCFQGLTQLLCSLLATSNVRLLLLQVRQGSRHDTQLCGGKGQKVWAMRWAEQCSTKFSVRSLLKLKQSAKYILLLPHDSLPGLTSEDKRLLQHWVQNMLLFVSLYCRVCCIGVCPLNSHIGCFISKVVVGPTVDMKVA